MYTAKLLFIAPSLPMLAPQIYIGPGHTVRYLRAIRLFIDCRNMYITLARTQLQPQSIEEFLELSCLRRGKSFQTGKSPSNQGHSQRRRTSQKAGRCLSEYQHLQNADISFYGSLPSAQQYVVCRLWICKAKPKYYVKPNTDWGSQG